MGTNNKSSYLVLPFYLIITTAASSLFLLANGATPLVDNVCSETRDQSLCTQYLTSDPRAPTASLVELADIAIQVTGFRANSVKQNIHDSLIRTADPVLKDRYGTCENLYLDALDSLFRVAPAELQAHQYGDLSRLAVQVASQIDGCEAAFGNNSPFKLDNRVVAVLAEAIAVIARNL